MGHATSQGDRIFSAGDYDKYVLPIIGMKEVDLEKAAQEIATSISMDRTYDDLRANLGDCAVAIRTAGITTIEKAQELSTNLHLDPSQQERIAKFGGLFVGAVVGLKLFYTECRPNVRLVNSEGQNG